MNLLESAIATISPSWSAKRAAAKAEAVASNGKATLDTALIEAVNDAIIQLGYDDAKQDRLSADWDASSITVNDDLKSDRVSLVDRSVDMGKNNPIAKSYKQKLVDNAVGSGFRPQSTFDLRRFGIDDPKLQSTIRRELEARFEEFANTCDCEGIKDLTDICEQTLNTLVDHGEAVFMYPRLPLGYSGNRSYSLSVQTISPNRLDMDAESVQELERMGVKRDRHYGNHRAYRILDKEITDSESLHGSMSGQWYPRYDNDGRIRVNHVFKQLYPGQVRGIPYLTGIMGRTRHLDAFTTAQLQKQRIGACISLIIPTRNALGAATGASTSTNSIGERLQKVQPGGVYYVDNVDGSPYMFNPGEETNGFEPYVTYNLRLIAAGLGFPYEALMDDFRNMSYSNYRGMAIVFRSHITRWQNFLSRKALQPIYDMFVEESILRGYIPGVSYDMYASNPHACCSCYWQPTGWDWVDPKSEVEASGMMVDLGLSTLTDEAVYRGKDVRRLMETREEELAMMEDLPHLKKYMEAKNSKGQESSSPKKPAVKE